MFIYQAGPMRGLDLYNFNAFENGARFLRGLGNVVVSPHEIDIEEEFVDVDFTLIRAKHEPGYHRKFTRVELTDRFSIEGALRRDFAAICDSDAISCLPGWSESDGTRKEVQVARWVGLPIYEHDPENETFKLYEGQ